MSDCFKCAGILSGCGEAQSVRNKNCAGAETSESNKPDSQHADPGDAPARHAPHAGQRSPSLLFCILHLRDHWSATLGRATAPAVLHQ